MVAVPVGEFQQNIPNSGFGLSAMFGYSIGTMPVVLGLEGGFAVYGSKERSEPFSTTIPMSRSKFIRPTASPWVISCSACSHRKG